MTNKPIVKKLICTCQIAPEQYEGELEDGRSVYARERHGHVRVEINNVVVLDRPGDSAMDALMEMFMIPDHVIDQMLSSTPT